MQWLWRRRRDDRARAQLEAKRAAERLAVAQARWPEVYRARDVLSELVERALRGDA